MNAVAVKLLLERLHNMSLSACYEVN